MTESVQTLRNARIFDGTRLHVGMALRVEGATVSAMVPDGQLPDRGEVLDFGGDILSPGFTDLQVNGGGGILFNDAPTLETLRHMAAAHRGLGVTRFLPTLITDTPQTTRAAIAAAIEAAGAGVPGIAGLHLEGPHLSLARKGAHDGALIRPMRDEDLQDLLAAARGLPCLKVTLAPENVTEAQVAALAQAGVLVSLGHTDADFETCRRYFRAGARCATHLFNAMSQLGSREPGLVGAVLASGQVSAGIIADGIHVHPAALRTAVAAKTGPGGLFLVSDAMAIAGTDQRAFRLNGREIRRRDGRLTLADGTLAGADLDLVTALRTMVEQVGLPLEEALAAATRVPAEVIGIAPRAPGNAAFPRAELIRISRDLRTVSVV